MEILSHLDKFFLYFCLIVVGSCIGSFLNVVRLRSKRRESIIYPSSYCFKCKTKIPFYFNIPILSWIILGGKCSACGKKIDISYLFVELILAVTFVLNGFSNNYFNNNYLELIGLCILSSYLLLIALVDYDTLKIPNSFLITGSITGLLLLSLAEDGFMEIFPAILYRLFCAFAGFFTLEAITYVYFALTRKIGFGAADSKYIAFIGIWIGLNGMYLSLLLAIYIAGIFSLVGLSLGRIKKYTKIPFGPFISIGSYIVLILGQELCLSLLAYPFKFII